MQLTTADVNTTRTYHFEANEKDNSPNSLQNTSALIPYKWRRYPRCTSILVSVTSPDKDRLLRLKVTIVLYKFILDNLIIITFYL